MSVTDTVRSVASHRGVSCLELHRQLGEQDRELRQLRPRVELVTAMDARIGEQALTIGSLREQIDTAKTIRDDIQIEAGRYREAEARAQAAERQLAEQTDELIALRQFKANVTSVSSLPQAPDPTNEVTAPHGIDVRTLREAANAGLLEPGPDPGGVHTH